jgi:hypothetical protein
MSLQKSVLERYRHNFPNDTLREISTRTQLGLTRVHRLMNGYDMRVDEMEKFEKAIALNSTSPSTQNEKFMKTLYQAIKCLSVKNIDEVIGDIEKRIFTEQLKNPTFNPSHT